LHAFLKIRNRAQKRWRTHWANIRQQVWQIYHAPDPQTFRQRSADFLTWARFTLTGSALQAIEKLWAKTETFVVAFAFPQTYRTSNMIDRHMLPLARCLSQARTFHAHWTAAERQIRAWALCHNFGPYCPRARAHQTYRSPAHRLNGKVFHTNWLHNLLISTSATGFPAHHRIRQN